MALTLMDVYKQGGFDIVIANPPYGVTTQKLVYHMAYPAKIVMEFFYPTH